MLSKTLLIFLVASPLLVLGQVLSCSSSTTCFSSGPSVNFTQAALVIPNACVSMAGSFIHDEQRHFCALNGPSPSKFDFVIRRTGKGTGSVTKGTCETNMNALLQGSQCGGSYWERAFGNNQHGGRFTVGDWTYLAFPTSGMCVDLTTAPKTPVCAT